MDPGGQGIVKGQLHPAPFGVLYRYRARQYGALSRGGDDLELLGLHFLIQDQGQHDIIPGRGAQRYPRAVVRKNVMELSVGHYGAVVGKLLLHIRQIGGDVQPHGVPADGVAGGGDQAVYIGQIHDVDDPFSAQVILEQILLPGGTQNGGQGGAVLFIYPSVPVHIAQSKGGVSGAHHNVPGVVGHGHLLAVRLIALAGKGEGIFLPLGQALEGDLQETGPQSAQQLPAVGVFGCDLGLIAAHGVGAGLRQRDGAQDLAAFSQLYLYVPALKLIQPLSVIDPHCGCHAACYTRCGGGRKGGSVEGAHHGRRYQRRQHPDFRFLLHDTTSFPALSPCRGRQTVPV